MGSGTARTMSGSYYGTTLAKTIVVGFKPRYVRAVNTVTPKFDQAIHWSPMPDASCIQLDAGVPTFETTNGITLTDIGFTLAASCLANVNGDLSHWFAVEE